MAYIVKHILKSGTKYYVQYKKDKKTFTYGKYPTKKLAEKAKLQLEVDIAEESLSKIQSIKVSELWDNYKKRKSGGIAHSTLSRYELSYKCFKEHLGDIYIDKITMDLIYSFLDSRKKKVVNKTLNHDIKFLRMFFDNAVKWDYIKENLFKKIDNLPLTDSKKINSLSKAEITKIISEIDRDVEKWFYNIFLFALYTGMRRGELAALTWSDQSSNYIDFDENLIKINKTKVKSNIRNIPIHEKIKKILLELRHLHKENGFSDDYVFRNFNGNPINATPLSISEKFKKITKRAGLEHITRFHSTRHTFVTHFVKFTKDKLLTSFISGHTSNAIDGYIHDVHAEEKQKAIEDFEY